MHKLARQKCGVKVGSGRFLDFSGNWICRWGAYENQQKSRNHPDPPFTLHVLEFCEKFGVKGGSGQFLNFSGNLPMGSLRKSTKI